MSGARVTVITLSNNFAAVKTASQDALKKAVMAGGQVVEAYAKINVEHTFSSKATGGAGLGGSIQTVLSKTTSTEAEADVGPTVIYGRIQELGGIIKPVFAQMLHWINDAGEDVFANVVHIPPRPYLRPALDDHKEEVLEAIGYQLKQAIERVAGD
jgi:phage gpG-like protein